MTPVKFPEQNQTLARSQPQYRTLPVRIETPDEGKPEWIRFTAKYELNDLEIAQIIRTRSFYSSQEGFGFNPSSNMICKPWNGLVIEYRMEESLCECWVPMEDGSKTHVTTPDAPSMVDLLTESYPHLNADNLHFVERPELSINEKGEIEEL